MIFEKVSLDILCMVKIKKIAQLSKIETDCVNTAKKEVSSNMHMAPFWIPSSKILFISDQ